MIKDVIMQAILAPYRLIGHKTLGPIPEAALHNPKLS
jgi:hypothetical protein